MDRPRLVPFRAEHLLMLERPLFDVRMAFERERHPAFTAVVGDQIIGCAGVVIPWPGMGVAWVVFTVHAAKYKVWTTRTIKRILRDIMRAHRLRRVEATALLHNKSHQRWLETFGFIHENGAARYYLPDGSDVVRYELIGEQNG